LGVESEQKEREMKAAFRKLLRWAGPLAIAGGVFAVLSELVDLPVVVPGLSGAAPTGYDAVGSGVLLISMTLLLVGMAGLYARQAPRPGGARVIEHGNAFARYLDVPDSPEGELGDPEERPEEARELRCRSGYS
jgi:hypothetical protein